MVKVTRRLAVGVVLAGAAFVLAAPASAEPLSGSYTFTRFEPEPHTQEVILTPCGPDCTNWRYLGRGELPDGFNFHLHGNQWVDDTNSMFVFDKDSLKGSQGIPANVPNGAAFPPVPTTLTKNG